MVLKEKTCLLLYILYAVILGGVFLFFRFPKEQLELFVIHHIETVLPGKSCTIESLSYAFPLSLQAEGIKFTNKGDPLSKPFKIETAILKPHILSPSKISIATHLYGGYFAGILDSNIAQNQITTVNFTLKNLNLEDLNANFSLSRYPISGLVEVSGSYKIRQSIETAVPEYSGKLILRNGTIKTEQPVLSLTAIDIQYLEMTFVKKNGTIEFTHGKLQGEKLHSTFTGTLQLLHPLGQSLCQLQGQLVPQQSFLEGNQLIKDQVALLQKRSQNGTIPYSASGQLANLTFRFNNI